MRAAQRGYLGLELIGGFKLLKAVLLLIGAVLLPIFGKRHIDFLFLILRQLSVDPHAKYFQEIVRKVIDLSPKFPLISVGMACYGVIFCVEGIGLLLRKRWAQYLTVIVTASFLPFEIYEMIHHTTVIKGVVIGLNAAILIYLLLRIKYERKGGQSASTKLARIPRLFRGLRASAR